MSKNNLIARDQDKTPASMQPDAHREDEDDTVSDVAPEANGQDEPRDHAPRPERAPKIGRAPGTGLKIYKPGQGYYVRVGTAVGAAILIVFGAGFLYDQVGTVQNQFVRFGVPLAFMVVSAALCYWVVGLNRGATDFFVFTEGEMKKVSWSSRKEVIRSTKVVIVTVVLMATLLFVVDIGFMLFFEAIGVLKGGVDIKELFSGPKQ